MLDPPFGHDMITPIKARSHACASSGEYSYHVCHSIYHPKATADTYVATLCHDAGGL